MQSFVPAYSRFVLSREERRLIWMLLKREMHNIMSRPRPIGLDAVYIPLIKHSMRLFKQNATLDSYVGLPSVL